MSRHHRGFTYVPPAGRSQPVTPGWNRGPWTFPQAPPPAITRSARWGGNEPCALARVLAYDYYTVEPPRQFPLFACDLVSHAVLHPVAAAAGGQAAVVVAGGGTRRPRRRGGGA